MKIALLGDSGTVHLQRLARALADRGHYVHVVSMARVPIEGIRFEKFAVPRMSLRYPYRWRGRWRAWVRRLFDSFDIVNVHFLADWGIEEPPGRRGRLVVKAYGSDIDHPPDTPAPNTVLVAARRRLLQCADRIVSPSRFFAGRIVDYAAVDPGRIDVLPFGVDTELFQRNLSRAKRSEDSTGDALTVGYFKGFDPVYDPMTMIEAAAIVHQHRPAVRFEFVGAGSQLNTCRKRACSLGLQESIRWIDRQAHDALPAIMSRWDVVGITSVAESFCVSAIEASAMEIPVVATDVGGLSESVEDGRTGILVPARDAKAVAEAMITLLDNAALRERMGKYSQQRVVTRFDWNDCVEQWITLFQSVLARGSNADFSIATGGRGRDDSIIQPV